jgi:hypothetical protein
MFRELLDLKFGTALKGMDTRANGATLDNQL